MNARQMALVPAGPVTLWLAGGGQLSGTAFVFDKMTGLVTLTMDTGGKAYVDIDHVAAFVNPAIVPPP